MIRDDSPLDHTPSVSRYGRPHGERPEEAARFFTRDDLVDALGEDLARELRGHMDHVGLDGRGVIDAAAIEDYLGLRRRSES
jgi:hypothetical protein